MQANRQSCSKRLSLFTRARRVLRWNNLGAEHSMKGFPGINSRANSDGTVRNILTTDWSYIISLSKIISG